MSPLNNKPAGSFSAVFALARGRVQGVGFRYSCLNEGRRLGLFGWVRNTHDGNVEVWAEGNREKLEALLKWLRHGPPGARVDSVLEEPRLPTGKYKTFSVEY